MVFKKTIKRRNTKQIKLFYFSVFLLVFSYLIVLFAKINVDFTTKYYTFGIYRQYITLMTKINSFFPFSVAEVLITLFCLYLIFYLVFLVYTLKRNIQNIFNVFLALFTPICVIIFMFTISYLPNYHQHTFYHYSGLEMRETSVDNLVLLCESLVNDANLQRSLLNQDGQVFDYTKDVSTAELFEFCTNSYKELIKDYPEYENLFNVLENSVSKPVFFSEVMSYISMNGGFFAITGEANININASDIFIPSTVCHELAHVAGFMREDEANFIAYITCRSSDSEILNYSGTMLALLHSTNALYSKNSTKYFEVMSNLSSDVKRDLDAHDTLYYKYQTPIRTVSKSVNDTYLKANSQTDGINSYGRMVDLLIADFELSKN